MASTSYTRLATVNARDGVNTRNKVNWAATAARKTICRSDMIIDLGLLAANQSMKNVSWGDFATDNLPREVKPSRWAKAYSAYSLWEDMLEEPAKYGNDNAMWVELNKELMDNGEVGRVIQYWWAREEREQAANRVAQKHWKKVFAPIAIAAAAKGETRWIQRDIKAFLAKIKKAVSKIQAFVRGHQYRCHSDCCMCLSHTFSPVKTEVGFMCRECHADGPYTDQVPNDPWNWFRSV